MRENIIENKVKVIAIKSIELISGSLKSDSQKIEVYTKIEIAKTNAIKDDNSASSIRNVLLLEIREYTTKKNTKITDSTIWVRYMAKTKVVKRVANQVRGIFFILTRRNPIQSITMAIDCPPNHAKGCNGYARE